ncbi:MAG: GAF domain-containing protein [Acidobacteriia bacterium]|nr:GAF domain-containing protein [Terriglobia bacterium]
MVSWERLNEMALGFLTERNTDSLLEKILTGSREVTVADAGSLYLVEEGPGGGRYLVFKSTQVGSLSLPFRQFTLPIDTRSIAGYVAATGEILNIEDAHQIENLPFQLNKDFDQKFGYPTKSMLVIPLKSKKGEVIGVLQLINAKRDREAKLLSPEAVAEVVISFSEPSQEKVSALAIYAAAALENSLLYRETQRMFEGVVKALMTLLESRDPTTFGRSERVAKLTLGLAEAVDKCGSGPYKDVHFTPEDLQELRFASLLQDIGMIGVPELLLGKAKKLFPWQLDLIKKRFQYISKRIEVESLRKKLDFVMQNGNQNFQAFFAGTYADQLGRFKTLEEYLDTVRQANEPTELSEKASERLREIAGWTFQDSSGSSEPLLTTDELKSLSIPKGSLDDDERLRIESHVINSFRFLSQIPWTKELKNIPEIVRAHHEKLDGSGYPSHRKGEEIPLQSRMITLCDIFVALTARDRPFRRAVPVERALDLMGVEAQSNLLDPELFRLFVDAKVYELTAKS